MSALLIALIVYPPLLLTKRGTVVADTKQYLTLDPQTMLSASTSLWDPDWALGTVTHQSIGYLWPMGPWMVVCDWLGLPVWFAQRLWLATIVAAAGAGFVYLGKVLGWSSLGSFVGGLAYALSPYPLAYSTRMSALVMPWAGLGWLVALAVVSLRTGEGGSKWAAPARLALVVTTIGAINASSLIFVGLAVIAWFPFAVLSHSEATPKEALAAMTRIGVACIGTSAWWVVGLAVQGQWGPDVLRFSETLEVVASGSPSSEAWRGLGYWVFYGGDRTGPWVSAGEAYTQNPLVMTATFSLSIVAVLVLLVVRNRYRPYLLGLAILGLVLTVGLYPYLSPSPAGNWVASSAAESTIALALRSSPRALPLYLLAVSASIAMGLDALSRQPKRARVAAAAVVVLVVIGIKPLWTGDYVGYELARPEEVNENWSEAADYLNTGDPNGRVVILPGSDFAAHTWGNTIDHILPGLIERPVAIRELIPYGSDQSADLLIALDRRAQERQLEPQQLGAVVRLLGASDLVIQSDLEFERYRSPRPDDFWRTATSPESGLATPVSFGEPISSEPDDDFPMLDAIRFGLPVGLPQPPPVAVFPIPDPLGVVRLRPASRPLLVVGDGETILELAGAGLLDPDRIVLYEADLSDQELADALTRGAEIVLSDGNRLRARRWKTIRDNLGITESLTGDGLDPDPTDARLSPFGEIGPESFTTTLQLGVFARSSSYGNPVSFHAEDRAAHAVDGDFDTAWRTGAFSEAVGESIEITWSEPVGANTLHLAQPFTLDPNRTITEVGISLNGGGQTVVVLDERSETKSGQPIDLGPVRVQTVRLEVLATSAGVRPGYGGLSSVGFSEVWLDDQLGSGEELIVTPTSLSQRLDRLGIDIDANPISVVLSRERVDPAGLRDDPETSIRRLLEIPRAAEFDIFGSIRLSGRASEAAMASALDTLDAEVASGDRVNATSLDRLPGSAAARSDSVVDGDVATIWRTDHGTQVGDTITISLPANQDLSSVGFSVVADGRHSVPLVFELTTNEGDTRTINLGPIADQPAENAQTLVTAEFEPISASVVTLKILETREVRKTEWYSGDPVEQPIGLGEIIFPGLNPVAPTGPIDQTCRGDLVTVAGAAVPVRLIGTVEEAIAGDAIRFESCGTVSVTEGSVEIVGSSRASGLAVDRLVMVEVAEGTSMSEATSSSVLSVESSRGLHTVTIEGATDTWLVLGESYNEGWAAVIGGEELGPPVYVDGFANGWLIDGSRFSAGPLEVELIWRPNRSIRWALVFSALSALLAIAFAVRPVRWSATRPPSVALAFESDASRLYFTARLVVTLAFVSMATVVFVGPAYGLVVVLVALLPALVPRLALLPLVVGVASVGLMGAYVTALQIVYQAPHDGAWPSLWGKAHIGGLVGVSVLIAELVVSSAARVRPNPNG